MDRSVFELFRLDGKVAIVTGAHAWLGYDIACAFAEAGADVIITSRNVDSIRETAAQIGEKYHVDTLALPLDQRKYENVQKMADAALAWKGHIDILVNNAGGGSGKTEGDFLKRDPADIQNLIDINLTGSVFCSKAVGAMMPRPAAAKSSISLPFLLFSPETGVPTIFIIKWSSRWIMLPQRAAL